MSAAAWAKFCPCKVLTFERTASEILVREVLRHGRASESKG
ncbi:hypothetical protein GXM_07741 [Nostoc sphaeroides CCNUC1]|uniref:Uncharacterized protein n=1 Tax=Nostoc sphaeroides CCNUC1 TaxID=2653204 RepID=A0A5P8WBS3_9NOSO|nr:hypothetical protein GXM_07741 [Nostoc sphaeroides CCNUC1]